MHLDSSHFHYHRRNLIQCPTQGQKIIYQTRNERKAASLTIPTHKVG
jgi:hypothetical protein